MTLQTSGAISFTDLKNEYGGSATDIALGNYAAKQQTGDTVVFLIGWDGYSFTIGGSKPSILPISLQALSATTRVILWLDSSVTVPVNITTSITTDGSSLASSGVQNNGAVYNSSGGYHYGYTQIEINTLGTAIGNSGSESANYLYLSTNQAQTVSASDSTSNYIAFQVSPTSNRNVTQKCSYGDLAFPASLAGGSETALIGGGTLFAINATNTGSMPGVLRNGDSIQLRGDFETSGDGIFPGGGNQLLIYMYGQTHTIDTNLAHSPSAFGTSGYAFWTSGAINTSGVTNSGSGLASFFASNLPAAPSSATGSMSTSLSASWSSSGSTLICTLTNNSGSTIFLYGTRSNDTTKNLPWIYAFGNSSGSYKYSNSANEGTNGQTQRYGANMYSKIVAQLYSAAGSLAWSYTFYNYHSAGINRANLISEISTMINDDDGFGNAGSDYRDTGSSNVGNGRGLYSGYFQVRASEPTTGTLRLTHNLNQGGFYFNTLTYTNWNPNNNVYYSAPRGTTGNDTGNNASTNFAPTITKFPSSNASTAEATGNFAIECGRQNMLMSEYYGGDGS